MSQDLLGKRVVITGGASGIGAGAVAAFHAAGAQVMVADLDAERGQALARQLGPAVTFQRCNVAVEADVAALIGRAREELGGIDCLWNNAGMLGEYGKAETHSWEGYRQLFDVVVGGSVLGIKHAAPIMKEQKQGCIINTASIAGLLSGYGSHLYTAAKHAVIGLTRSAATELGRHFVRVNAIAPGAILTPLIFAAEGGGPEAEASARAILPKVQPVPRAGLPEDVAALGVFLASDRASFINGAIIPVDGGASAGLPWNPLYEGRQQ
jgi:NAD(P)-dependent dehydrogenase (short-subunit alcohol dehydrogenase family)